MKKNSSHKPATQRNADKAPTRPRGILGQLVKELGLRVMNGTYAPPHKMPTESDLVAELGVSRTAVREAVKVLTAKGLVESRTKVGMRMRPMSDWNLLDRDILELYCQVFDASTLVLQFQQIRVIIEPEAAALAAEARTPAQLRALDDAYADMAAATDITTWTAADLAFHRALLDATGNVFMRPLGNLIQAALEDLLLQSARNSPDPFKSLAEHAAVLKAVRDRDPDAARQTMQALLGNTALNLQKIKRTRKT